MTTPKTSPSSPDIEETGQTLDITNCDSEPIHIPGCIQPHGVLITLDPGTLTVLQLSDNTEDHFGIAPDTLLGKNVETLFGSAQTETLRQATRQTDPSAWNPIALSVSVGGHERSFHGVIHRSDRAFVLEMEPAPSPSETNVAVFGFYRLVKDAMARLQQADSVRRLCEVAVEEIRRLTGFDRVMVYRFDALWNGQVLAEEKRATMDSYMDLHFPASDIPAQARELYRKNWLRFVVDSTYRPSLLVPQIDPLTGRPLDMSFSVLRSVSPIHLEYLRNMGVAASMSVSVLRGNQLWGLIACHNATPRYVPYEIRIACEFLGQILSSQIAIREESETNGQAARLRAIRETLVAGLSKKPDLFSGLSDAQADLLALTQADGAAIVIGDRCCLLGQTPTESQVRALMRWLSRHSREDVFASDDLPRQFPASADYADRASGVLVIFLSPSEGVLWFRSEVVRTVNWAGDPHKPIASPDNHHLHPRTSFAQWQETVRGTASPWIPSEQEAARELRNALTALALRGAARQLSQLNQKLARQNQDLDAFAYIASHDLRAPLRGISQLVDWMEEDLGEVLGQEGAGYLEKLRGRVKRMEGLISGVLEYSRVGRSALAPETVDVGALLIESVDLLAPRPGIQVSISPGLPTLTTERLPLQQVFMNLIGNAIKHNSAPEGHIWVSGKLLGNFWEFTVQDDGPGIATEYHEKIFGIFQTLQARDNFESTGIGLALIKKIITEQGGVISVESQPGHGATFRFTWPLTSAHARIDDHDNSEDHLLELPAESTATT